MSRPSVSVPSGWAPERPENWPVHHLERVDRVEHRPEYGGEDNEAERDEAERAATDSAGRRARNRSTGSSVHRWTMRGSSHP